MMRAVVVQEGRRLIVMCDLEPVASRLRDVWLNTLRKAGIKLRDRFIEERGVGGHQTFGGA